MIYYVRGILVYANTGFAVLEAAGIGYKIFIPPSAFSKLPEKGKEAVLHTSLVIRELSHTLYGFCLQEERDVFEELTAISGVGPKIALSLIGHLSIAEMHAAIESQDTAVISRVPGIGRKTAQRIIIELRDRLHKSAKAFLPSDFAVQVEGDPRAQKITDAISALLNLGYKQNVAQKAIKKSLATLSDSIELPDLITDALKNV